jgi:SPP1 family predicted phage head-tail adaptor
MRAGRRDRLVELRHRVVALDPSSGQEVESWPEAYATVWAEKIDVRSREFLAGSVAVGEITTTFRILYRTDVLSTDRIVYGGLAYNIQPPIEIGRREGLELMATVIGP